MAYHPPPMSPLRVFVNGVPVDSPSKVAAEPGAPAKGATSIPTPPPADDSFWGTGAWKIRVDGLDVAAPSPGAVQPPASGPPTAGHVRVLVGGEEVPLIVRGPREVSPGEAQQDVELARQALARTRAWDGGYRLKDGTWHRNTEEEKRQYQAAEDAVAAREHYRQVAGRLLIHPFEERR